MDSVAFGAWLHRTVLHRAEFAHGAYEFCVLAEDVEQGVAALAAPADCAFTVFRVVRWMAAALSLPPDTPDSQHFTPAYHLDE